MNHPPLVLHTLDAGIAPEDLLDASGDAPRGYLSRDGVTTAWLGAARVIRAPDLNALSDLCRDAWQGAPETARAFVVAPFMRDPRHARDPAWSAAHDAVWVLPELSITRTAAGCVAQALAAARGPVPTLPPPSRREHSQHPTTAREPDPSTWTALVTDALAAMRAGEAEKIVGARRVLLQRAGGWSLRAVLRELDAHATPHATRFGLTIDGTSFVGLSPETLLTRAGGTLRTEALAGSLPRRPDRDATDQEALRRSEKDQREHALVREMILRTLAPWCAHVEAAATPAVRSLRALHHLWTPITATLREGAPGALTMAAALHPTPAVAGLPVADALRWIAAHEPHPRGWFAGALGWCDARGDGEFAVAIRSAVLRGERAWAYAGAGLVPGSDPAREWEETAVKMSMMREALGA